MKSKEKQLMKILIVALVLMFVSVLNFAQDGIKFRVAVNTGLFLSEPGSGDAVIDPLAAAGPLPDGKADFSSRVKLGLEAEISIPVSETFALGVEIKDTKYGGNNDNPVYYNYFASAYSPILNYQQEPLIYDTDVISLLGDLRFYPLGQSTFTPYLKVFGGIAMIGTDLRFKNVADQVDIMDPLYSRGTRLSISEPDRFSTAQFGGGIGFDYQLPGNFSVCTELSLSYINSDIIDGVPNFTYDAGKSRSVYHGLSTMATQLSAGVSYAFGGSGKSKYGRPGSGRSRGSSPFSRRR